MSDLRLRFIAPVISEDATEVVFNFFSQRLEEHLDIMAIPDFLWHVTSRIIASLVDPRICAGIRNPELSWSGRFDRELLRQCRKLLVQIGSLDHLMKGYVRDWSEPDPEVERDERFIFKITSIVILTSGLDPFEDDTGNYVFDLEPGDLRMIRKEVLFKFLQLFARTCVRTMRYHVPVSSSFLTIADSVIDSIADTFVEMKRLAFPSTDPSEPVAVDEDFVIRYAVIKLKYQAIDLAVRYDEV